MAIRKIFIRVSDLAQYLKTLRTDEVAQEKLHIYPMPDDHPTVRKTITAKLTPPPRK